MAYDLGWDLCLIHHGADLSMNDCAKNVCIDTYVNVYDFDYTIYDGDSTLGFWKFCLLQYPRTMQTVPFSCMTGLKCKILHLCGRERFKEIFYRFLRYVPPQAISNFWDRNEHKIKTWYLKRKEKDDIIISASPEFLLSDICSRLNVRLIASGVDFSTGKLTTPNCHGEEKVRRFHQEYPNDCINEFFSDSLSDIYLARIAKRAYLVHKNKIKDWGNL